MSDHAATGTFLPGMFGVLGRQGISPEDVLWCEGAGMGITSRGLLTAMTGKGRAGKRAPWWDGRRVAIRPDVPGPHFDPDALVLIRSDQERVAAQARIDQSIDETKSATDLWPHWLWQADEVAADAYEDSLQSEPQ